MTPVAGISSIGTVALVGGVVIIAGVVYLLYRNNNNSNSSKKTIKKIISDENYYKGTKKVVINAIEEKDWDTLEELLKDKSLLTYPDLVKIAKESLEEKK